MTDDCPEAIAQWATFGQREDNWFQRNHDSDKAFAMRNGGQNWTPGPWRIGEAYEDDEGYREVPIHTAINGRDYTPASVCLQFPSMPGMQDANARLIAAAPSLYEALEEILDLGPEAEWGDPSGKKQWREARRKATAALAKARGEP